MINLGNLLRILVEAEIDFVLVGGYAGIVHGSTQVTRDLDICMAVTDVNVSKLRAALGTLNPRHRMNPSHQPSFLDVPKDLAGWQRIYLSTDVGVLDVLGEISGVGDFERIKAGSVEIRLYGSSCRVISIEDLILSKERLGRDKDKAVVRDLRAIMKVKSDA